MILDDLMKKADLLRAARELSRGLAGRFGLGPVAQLGLVVPDVREAALALEETGIGPFFLAAGPVSSWREKGRGEVPFSGSLGLAYHRGLELELLEPGEGSDFYRRSLDSQGRVKVQHLGFLVPDVDGAAREMEKAGMPVEVRGRIRVGPLVADFAYMDTEKEAGIILELIGFRLMGLAVAPFPPLVRLAGRAQKKWGPRVFRIRRGGSGREPI